MTNTNSAKIDFSFGNLTFTGEGTEDWLSAQLDKIISAAPSLSKLPPPENSSMMGGHAAADTQASPAEFKATLASYIKAKGGESNQMKRFMATADWLRQRSEELTTAAVSKALSVNHQKKLANAADCLNKNVAKGFCEKVAGGFFITPDGLKDLGHG